MTRFERALFGTVLGTLLAVAPAAPTFAADLYGGSLKDDPYVGMSNAARVYLRGDIGYGLVGTPSISESGTYELDAVEESDAWNYSGGIGWYLSERMRTDVTLDLRGTSDIDGVNIDTGPMGPGFRKFSVTSTYALANLYYDFNVHPQFAPYLGAGIGFAVNRTGKGVALDIGSGCACDGGFEGADSLSFAFALMAGFSSDWGEGVHFDAGYRFVSLGSAETGDLIRSSDAASFGSLTVDDMTEHQFRIGVRYDIF